MEPLGMDFLILALNAILIALILTAPLLVGLLIIQVLRKWLAEDKRAFEENIRSQLGKIAESQAKLNQEFTKLR